MASQTLPPPPPTIFLWAEPRLRRFNQTGILVARAGYRIKLPGLSSRFRVEGRDEPAHRVFSARNANDRLPFGDARRHCEGVVLLRVGDARFPQHFARLFIQSEQPAVDRRRDDPAVIESDSPLHNAAADSGTQRGLVHFRIPTPLFLARPGIHGKHDAPLCGGEDHAIVNERGCFLTAATRA